MRRKTHFASRGRPQRHRPDGGHIGDRRRTERGKEERQDDRGVKGKERKKKRIHFLLLRREL